MSNTVNVDLFERAAEQLDFWTGTIWEKIIQQDIDSNDLGSLYYHVKMAELQSLEHADL